MTSFEVVRSIELLNYTVAKMTLFWHKKRIAIIYNNSETFLLLLVPALSWNMLMFKKNMCMLMCVTGRMFTRTDTWRQELNYLKEPKSRVTAPFDQWISMNLQVVCMYWIRIINIFYRVCTQKEPFAPNYILQNCIFIILFIHSRHLNDLKG